MIDHHIHLGKDTLTGFYLETKTLSKRLDKFNLSGAIVFSCPNVRYNKKNPYKEGNKKIINASLNDQRFIPFLFVHPYLDRLDYLEREADSFKGFKLYPRASDMEYSYNDISNRRIIDLIIESTKPVIFHTGFRDGSRIKDLIWILERKKSPVVLVHSGDLIEEDLIKASKYEQSYIDVAPLATMLERDFFVNPQRRPFKLRELASKKVLNYLKNIFGSERIVWGSDSPWCDYLIKEGYEKEVRISKLMEELGLNKSFLEL